MIAQTQTATLRRAAFPQASPLGDVAAVAAGAALIAGAAQVSIPLPFTPVPITGQTFAVVLVGATLGTLRGGASGLVYLLAGLAGSPVYAGGAHGWSVISGASGGYLIAFPIAAALVGRLAERGWDRRLSSAVGAMLTGNLVIYLIGLPWLAASLGGGLDRTLQLGLYPFVPGDVLKIYLAAALLPAAWRLVGQDHLPGAGAR